MESDSPPITRVLSYSVLAIWIIVTNLSAFVSISRARGIPTNIRFPIMNILLSDVLNGLSIMVRVALNVTNTVANHSTCLLLMAWTNTTAFASLLIVSSIAIDRCICLYFEYAYLTMMTFRKVIVGQGAIWGLALLYAFIMFADYTLDYTETRCINMHTGTFARSFQCALGTITRLVVCVASVLVIIKIRKLETADQIRGLHTQETFKTTYKLLLIGTLFQIMYLPYYCLNVYLTVYPDKASTTQTFFVLAGFITVLNGCINPFIFAWRFPECRAELRKIMCFFNKRAVAAENEKKKKILVSFL